MRKSTLDQLHDATDVIRDVATKLNRLSHAFDVVGNHKIAVQLFDYSVWLDDSVKEILNANSQELNDRMNDAQATTGALLSLALNPDKIRGNNE